MFYEESGNMSDNARIEQYVYENNKQVFEFHKQWIGELCNEKGKASSKRQNET